MAKTASQEETNKMVKAVLQSDEETNRMAKTEPLKVVDEQAASSTEPEMLAETETSKSGLLASVAIPDHFNVDDLVLDGDVTDTVAVTKHLDKIPIRKPSKQTWFRVHTDPELIWNATVIEIKDDNEFYVVPSALRKELVGEHVAVTFYTAINRQGVVFLWPVRLPDDDGKDMDCWSSQREHAEYAKTKWTRIVWNKSLRAYEKSTADNMKAEPEWPELNRKKVMDIAFKGKIITSLDHPVVKALRDPK
jgi:hypothetical protein